MEFEKEVHTRAMRVLAVLAIIINCFTRNKD